MQDAIQIIHDKQEAAGRWTLEFHYTGKTHADFCEMKQPNKWVTIRALRVLRKVAA